MPDVEVDEEGRLTPKDTIVLMDHRSIPALTSVKFPPSEPH